MRRELTSDQAVSTLSIDAGRAEIKVVIKGRQTEDGTDDCRVEAISEGAKSHKKHNEEVIFIASAHFGDQSCVEKGQWTQVMEEMTD
jgi:hypothetical protein